MIPSPAIQRFWQILILLKSVRCGCNFHLSDLKMRTPVLGPDGFTLPPNHGSLLAVADGGQARSVNAQIDQKRFYIRADAAGLPLAVFFSALRQGIGFLLQSLQPLEHTGQSVSFQFIKMPEDGLFKKPEILNGPGRMMLKIDLEC